MILMKRVFAVAATLVWTSMIAASGADPLPTAARLTDEAQVTDAMVSMYIAATNDDLAKVPHGSRPGLPCFRWRQARRA
jgi:hypothetical protein